MRLYKNSAFVTDGWQHVADGDALPLAGKAIVSLARWRAEQPALVAAGLPVGVRIEPAEAIEPLADDIARLAVIALSFPKFTDGRSYSKARALREQLGFKGELRAVGEVLIDQVALMLRCGFDAFEITNEPTIRALVRRPLPSLAGVYQATGRSEAATRAHRDRSRVVPGPRHA